MVTAHWVCTAALSNQSILLTIIDVKSRLGVGQALCDHVKRLGRGVMSRMLNITSEVEGSSLFASMLQPSHGADGTVDDIEKYLPIGVV